MVKDTDEIAPDRTYVADQEIESLLVAVRRINSYRDAMERVKTNFTPMISKPIVPVEGKIVKILDTLAHQGTASLRELLETAPTLADLIASFMGVLELIKTRKILMEELENDDNSVRGAETRFFLNPDAPTDEEAVAEAPLTISEQ
jgi:chromatin segregation and condensation protein Rec8/ScpA/Scc1 (kleisin family)